MGMARFAAVAETIPLADGGSVTGDVVKFDGNNIMLHQSDDTYTNISWPQISQEGLKQLSANAKMREFAEPFILPDESQRPAKPEIQVNAVTRLDRPAPSFFGGFFKSGLGLFILVLIYGASLFAAFEISIVKARPAAQVMGVAAILPIIGPIIFLIMPMYIAPPPPEEATGTDAAGAPGAKPQPQIQIGDASWKTPEEGKEVRDKKPEPQIFTRGKFTFNKRFVETKFAPWMAGSTSEQAKKFTMEVRTMKEQFAVDNIASVGTTEVVFATARGPINVPFGDIQEIKLNPVIA
jgi:hypothetical protein